MVFEQIRYDAVGAVVTITLNRPEKLNAVTSVLIRELIAAFDAVDADDGARVVIVTPKPTAGPLMAAITGFFMS